MREFIIDRSKWKAGGFHTKNEIGIGPTCLLNESGYMCCLGQISRQLGWPIYMIKNYASPSDAYCCIKDTKVNKKILLNKEDDSEFAIEAMKINDDSKLSNRQRESKLKSLGKKFGLDIKFVGKSKKRNYWI